MKITPFEQPNKGSILSVLVLSDIHSEYIDKQGDLLCREMFCRMNRQGGGQNSSGGSGATESDCSAISAVAINALKVETCMPYWTEKAGSDQNSQYWRCMTAFGQKP